VKYIDLVVVVLVQERRGGDERDERISERELSSREGVADELAEAGLDWLATLKSSCHHPPASQPG
jgi:hypothetical protein